MPITTPTTCGRQGRTVRLVIGAREFPPHEFVPQGGPAWRTDADLTVRSTMHRFEWLDRDEPVLTGSADAATWQLKLEFPGAEILGFGAATGAPTRNGSRFRVMTQDTLLYAIPGSSYTSLPFFMARYPTHSIGVLLATTYPLDVVIEDQAVAVTAACATYAAPIDVIVFRGSVVEIVADLAALVGRSFLPPAWALGFHQSRWSYKTEAEVLKVGRTLRQHDLPADVIHLDIHYMDRYRVFTFDPGRFGDPQAMHQALRGFGIRTMAIVDPGVSVAPYLVHDTLRSQDLLLTRKTGAPYEGRVWSGATVFPDFMNPLARKAWGDFHAILTKAGISGVWNDMNDPVLHVGKYYDPLGEDVMHGNVPHARVRNLYANGMAQATFEGLEHARPGRRPFVLSRSGFLGIQRHAAVWTGDNHSTWEHLRENLAMVLNLGLSGVPLSGADVGGFARGPGRLGVFKPFRPSAELFVRWMELGAWMPFFRVHCTLFARSQDPWSFGARALQLNRRILRRRYQWLPHLYRLALEAHEDGLPLVRPLFMHDRVAPGAVVEQFLLGRDVMVAPVLHRGVRERDVWLPHGSSWVDWRTGELFSGGQRIRAAAALGDTPVFVRSGAAIFLAEPRRNAEETLRAPLALEVTLPAAGQGGCGSLFLDDGESASGRRFLLDVTVCADAAGHLSLASRHVAAGFVPSQRHVELRAPAGCRAVSWQDRRIELRDRSLRLEDRARIVATAQVPLVP